MGTSEAPVSPRLQALYEYWLAKHRSGRLPSRDDLDPRDIRDVLPIVFLVDVVREPLRFRFRLVGTEFAAKYGRDFTGEFLDDLVEPSEIDDAASDFASCVADRTCIRTHRRWQNDSGYYWYFERILLPLVDDAGGVNMLLGGIDIRVPLAELPKIECQPFRPRRSSLIGSVSEPKPMAPAGPLTE